jgi:hypothetical protein
MSKLMKNKKKLLVWIPILQSKNHDIILLLKMNPQVIELKEVSLPQIFLEIIVILFLVLEQFLH